VGGVGGVINWGSFPYRGWGGVLPGAGGRGIGQAVMEHILAWIRARRIPMALLDASLAGEPLYRRLGFVADDQSDVWQHTEPGSLLQPSRAAVIPLRPEDIPALIAFDRSHFGADRATVLAALLDEFPGRGCAIRDASNRITGFLFTQPDKLGPWVAATPTEAEQLLHYALSLPFSSGPNVLVPGAN